MSVEVVENGVFSEDEFHDANDEEEQDATLVKKDVVTGVDEDRTDDQVPEITGTENVGDPMTISVDEVDEIPVVEGDVEEGGDEPKADEVPDQLENGAHADEEDGGGEVAEIPVDVVGEEEEPPAAEPQEEAAEEAAAEAEPEAADVAEEQPDEAEPAQEEEPAEEPAAPPAEEEEAVQEIPVEVVAEEEQLVQEVPVQEEVEQQEEEVAAEPEAQEEPAAAEETEDFQLQDPPQPKRPRTPNALDGAAGVEEDGDAVEAAEEPQGSVKGSQPGTPLPVGSPRRPSNAGSGVGSVPQTPKSPAGSIRRSSTALKSPLPNGSAIPESPLANGVVPGTPTPATPRSGAAAPSPRTETPKTKTEFAFEQASPVATPRTPKKTVFDEDLISTTSSTKSKSPPKSPRSPRRARSPKKSTKFAEPPVEAEPEPEPEPVVEEVAPAEEEAPQPEEPVEAQQEEAPLVDEEAAAAPAEAQPEEGDAAPAETGNVDEPVLRSRARVQSPSPPPRAAASREPRDYVPYDQDSHCETVPARLPTSTSFSSWVAPEREHYKAQSPWVNTAGKYRNEYTVGVPSHTAPYTSFFDDLVSTGPFSHSLYATSRLLERSRSRTRERRGALRSQRSASNYYRFASQYPAPLRIRDYSTPPTSAVNKPPSRAGSFISFLDYSGAKQYELARGTSYCSLYNSNQALSRSSSRSNIDYYLGTGRVSRVDSYVNNLNSRYEWQVPSNYEVYRSSSRGQVGYAPLNEYTSFTNSVYEENPRALRTAPVNSTMVRSMYEGRIDDLQRSLSRERYERDRSPTRRSRSRSSVRPVGPVLPFAAPHDPANDLTRSLYSGFARGWAERAY